MKAPARSANAPRRCWFLCVNQFLANNLFCPFSDDVTEVISVCRGDLCVKSLRDFACSKRRVQAARPTAFVFNRQRKRVTQAPHLRILFWCGAIRVVEDADPYDEMRCVILPSHAGRGRRVWNNGRRGRAPCGWRKPASCRDPRE